MEREVRYCTTEDGVNIAYCVEGDGPTTILALPQLIETFSLDHLMPVYKQFYSDLGTGRRVIRFDQRGTGLSRNIPEGVSTYGYSADLAAVADAAGRACVIWAPATAGPTALRFAVVRPELVTHLILYGTYAVAADALSQQLMDGIRSLVQADWRLGSQTIADTIGRREYPDEAAQLGNWFYQSMSGDDYLTRIGRAVLPGGDASDMLGQVQAPTLVLHRIADPIMPLSAAQKLAAGIPGARFVPLDGKGHLFCLGDYSPILASIDAFLGDRAATAPSVAPAPPAVASGTVVILFTDIADSTALTERMGDVAFRDASRALDDRLRSAIRDAGGSAIDGKLLGDGVLATFPSAAQAISAARSCHSLSAASELRLHLGIHAGDVIRERDNVYGGAVNIASRICALSVPGQILVSDVVRGMARTSAGVEFEDHGEQEMKGVGDPVRVYEVRWRDA
jgi:class 3 adenylate cyclase